MSRKEWVGTERFRQLAPTFPPISKKLLFESTGAVANIEGEMRLISSPMTYGKLDRIGSRRRHTSVMMSPLASAKPVYNDAIAALFFEDDHRAPLASARHYRCEIFLWATWLRLRCSLSRWARA